MYSICLLLFVTHLCLGWKKLVPADAMHLELQKVKRDELTVSFQDLTRLTPETDWQFGAWEDIG